MLMYCTVLYLVNKFDGCFWRFVGSVLLFPSKTEDGNSDWTISERIRAQSDSNFNSWNLLFACDRSVVVIAFLSSSIIDNISIIDIIE